MDDFKAVVDKFDLDSNSPVEKRYVREHGSMTDKWSRMFDLETRQQAAEGMAHYFETEWRLGQYRDLLPKKYQSK